MESGESEVPGMEETYSAAMQADMGQEHHILFHMKNQQAVDSFHHMHCQGHSAATANVLVPK